MLDQYDSVYDGYELHYAITLTEEAQTDDTHLNGSFEILENNTKNAKIRGAEIGDKCKVITNVVVNGGKTVAFGKEDNITIGSDTCAWISSADGDNDKNWRKADNYKKGDIEGLGLGMNR